MPRGDGTGPAGMGPMTGRAAGYCAGFGAPGFMNAPGGFGRRAFGRGAGFAGRGRGWRNWFYATGLPGWAREGYGSPFVGAPVPFAEPTQEDQTRALKEQAGFLEESLAEIKKRLADLQGASQES